MIQEASELDSAGSRSGRRLPPVRLVCAAAADAARMHAGGENVFGEIHFGTSFPRAGARDPGVIRAVVPVSPLGDSSVTEYWLSPSPVERGRLGEIRYGTNGQVMFAYTAFDFPASGAELERRTQRQYEAMLALLESQDYPYLLRVWNYLPHISRSLQGMECYRRFCRARYHAFAASFDDMIPHLPATSVLGTRGRELQTVFLAGKRRPSHYENPRQVSAYRYPQEYGPKSPLFARATLARWGGPGTLFISGTASIVGHESRHPGNVVAQAEEILQNLEALTTEVARQAKIPVPGLDRFPYLRVYIREPSDLTPIRRRVEARTTPGARVVYLQADICRPELLVEMEALVDLEPPV